MTDPDDRSPRARARAAARRAAHPVLGRLHAEAAGAVGPQLDAALAEVDRLRAELDTLRVETHAEIELLWAELAARAPTAASAAVPSVPSGSGSDRSGPPRDAGRQGAGAGAGADAGDDADGSGPAGAGEPAGP